MDSTVLILIFVIGVVAGFFDTTVGAGGLVSVPSLVFLGLPPQIAIGTDRLGALGANLTSLFKYWKAKKIVWKYVLLFSLITVIGALLGARILISINPNTLQKIIAVLLLLLLPVMVFKPGIGTEQSEHGKVKTIIGLTLYFGIMTFGGFLGQGTGPLIFITLSYFLGLTLLQIIATNAIPWVLLSFVSLIIFGIHGIINYGDGFILFIGMALGGYIGAHFALKKGDKWVRGLFIAFVIVAAIKLWL